jgi:nitrous oxide reductase
MKNKFVQAFIAIVLGSALFTSCKPKNSSDAAGGNAEKAYVAPGKYDEFYNFVSGGFSGQLVFMDCQAEDYLEYSCIFCRPRKRMGI